MNKETKENKKPKKVKKIIKILLAIIVLFIILLLGAIIYFITPVSNSNEKISITIPSGSSTTEIAHLLKENKLIKSEKVFVIYSKIKNVSYYAASYYLKPNMNLNEIIEELQTSGYNENETFITIKEGMHIRNIAKVIAENTNIKSKDFINQVNNKEYLNTLIEKYWFIKKDVKDKDIYYSLEGYLFPDTYSVDKENTTSKVLIEMMLEQMDKVLSEYKNEIEKSEYSIHELLTLASITQSEGYNESDFKNIASVFYNRLESNMPLGSCVTSYYGVKKDMTEELLYSDINAQNAYNTRGENPRLFPVGPISAPGKKAIEAVVKPVKTNYYYFVSDKNHKLYFTKTLNEHEQMITKLENEGLWLEW